MLRHHLFVERLESREMLSGTQTFTNTDPVAPLSTTPPPSGMSNLNASDFTYLGAQSLGQYNAFSGLAYRPETNTFFSILGAGQPPFDLVEFSNTGPSGGYNLVKNWGDLDTGGIAAALSGATLPQMEGLWWDDATQRLWVSFGDYYNANHVNYQVLAYVTLDTGTPVLHGPWGVVASVFSDQVKSEITPAPPQLASITGNQWMMFGGSANTNQDMSWGAGLVSVADPSSLAAGSLTSAEEIINWPMQYSSVTGDAYTDFPSGTSVTNINGNGDVNPPTTLSYEYNELVNEGGHLIAGDRLSNYTFIDTGNVEGFIYVGLVANGYAWYGNYNAHDDTSATGVSYQNNMTSLVHPGQPLVDGNTERGFHADQWQYNAYFVNYQDVLNSATAVQNGTATAATLQVAPNSITSLSTLGGSNDGGWNIIGSYFDPVTDNLYLLSAGTQELLEWHVAAPSSPLTIPAAPSSVTATGGKGEISLSWAPVSNAAYYTVYRGTTSGGEAVTPLITGLTSTSLADLTISAGGAYYYQVTAANAAGQSVRSQEVFVSLASPTPLTPHEQYVEAVYNDVLARPADPAGLTFWAHELDAGMPISSVAQSIAHSHEYYARFVIEPNFEKLLGRPADDATLNSLASMMESGLTDQQVEGSLLASNEFWTNAGATAPGWVGKVYQTLFGRAPDPSGLAFWEEALSAGETYSQVAQAIAASQENNTQLIEADYSHYLGRAADPAGLAAWLNQFTAGRTNEDVIAGFTGSLEYYALHTH